ncbi:MAG: phosphoribosylformimino-5-aminoimidazole carboxamide ribotide isomerase [Lachnoclostridium sp.]|jgi:phosphoribosylformimino-5-aminoimidazole carboxamide ribotide isomerase|nr:phosphoribosylformimino-5-aminoimidazole carboxamide ribotide isomerase [Lachnoclostridium sp.]
MKFRPCIDIHNGKVKQIIGASLKDSGDFAEENFVSSMSADGYAKLYKDKQRYGGHIIMLNGRDSEYYGENLKQAEAALSVFPGGLQIGGGITDENAASFLDRGASHVILTSFIFTDGEIRYDRLKHMNHLIGKEKMVLDLSCRKKNQEYYIVTDRWQTFTKRQLNSTLMEELSEFCDEFLVHAVDQEGKSQGPDNDLIQVLSSNTKIPVTYAGGITNWDDILTIKKIGKSKLDFTVGSALDLFGGDLSFDKIVTKY